MNANSGLGQLQEQVFEIARSVQAPAGTATALVMLINEAYALGCDDAGGNLAAAVNAVLDDPEACPAGTDTELIRRFRRLADRPQRVTRKITFRGTPDELAALLRTFAEHGVDAEITGGPQEALP